MTSLAVFMTPSQLLLLMITVTAAAGGVQLVLRRRLVKRLRALAQERKMHFSAADRFRLAARIVSLLPVPGAAAVRVSDLVYGVEQQHYRYVFRTEYTVGVLRSKTGIRRVARFREPRDRSAAPQLTFAPEHLPLLEQYRQMLDERSGTN